MSLEEWIDEVGSIGRNGNGVSRLAWTPELLSAGRWLVAHLEQIGLAAQFDAAGNVLGRWEEGDGPALLIGSHLDTVPAGGRFDGALGVLGGLEAIRRLKAEGFHPRRPIWLVAFNDEEGARFDTAMFGSSAFVGDDLRDLRGRPGIDGLTLTEAMAAAGFDVARVPSAHAVDSVGEYLELHIEQGPRMALRGLDTAVVSGIVGMRGFRIEINGKANHAGTTPMDLRRDALAGASRVVLSLRDWARARGNVTANVGNIHIEPGASNVVPQTATLLVDVRTADDAQFLSLEDCIKQRVAVEVDAEHLTADVITTYVQPPELMDADLQSLLSRHMTDAGLRWDHMPSGAGHDAQVMARHVPTAMLFVPSVDGISHAPEEYTPPEQCEPGVRVLTDTIRTLCSAV